MKDIKGTLQYNGKDIEYVFDLNVLQSIQEEYGSLSKWGELTDGSATSEPDAKAVIFGFTEMINEAVDMANDENGTNEPFYTRKQVGRILTEFGFANAVTAMNSTIAESTQSSEKNA